MINLMARLFAVSPAKGADTPLWVASAPELDGVTGKYFAARKEKPPKFRRPRPDRRTGAAVPRPNPDPVALAQPVDLAPHAVALAAPDPVNLAPKIPSI